MRDDKSANRPATSRTVLKFLAAGAGSVVLAGLAVFTMGGQHSLAADKSATPLLQLAKSGGSAAGFSSTQKAEIEKLIRSYLMENPEILMDMQQALKARMDARKNAQRKLVLAQYKEQIFRSPTDFVFGNPKGDVTVVEYFDYNCGWCKRAFGEVQKLVKADPNVRVVFKEFPIFGEHSEFAARAALASIKQGKYMQFHIALMKVRRVTTSNVMQIAKSVGLDVEQLRKDMDAPHIRDAIRETNATARALGIEGTPGFLIDSTVIGGFIRTNQMQSMLADVRKNGCKMC